jgi:ribosomal protein L16/L10AE
VEANVLRKPFKKQEVEQLVNESLNGKTPETLQNEQIEAMRTFMMKRLERETKDIEAHIIRKRIQIYLFVLYRYKSRPFHNLPNCHAGRKRGRSRRVSGL